jgi:hypothetical protein
MPWPVPNPALPAGTGGGINDPHGLPLTYLLYDLATGAYKGRLPLNGVTFGSQLLNPGTCSGTLDLASPAVQNLGPLTLTAPARTCLAIDYMGALIWGGIVWPRNYKFDSTSRQLQITATELWSYFGQRVQATDYSSPPYSGLSGPGTRMTIWDATHTAPDEGGPGVYDPILIAWQLISDALTQVRYGNILGGLGIAANSFTTTAGYLASGTQTPTGDYLSVNYPYASLQQVHSIINMLASNGLLVGFDYAIDLAYSGGTGSVPVGTINLSYPRRGRKYAQNQLVLNCGQALHYELPEDGTQAANTIYEQGSSQALLVSQNIAPLQGGYPILEQIKSRANIQSANVLNVLTQLGVADLAISSYPIETPTVTTDLFNGSVPLGQFIVGDDVRMVVPQTDGTGNVWDPRLPNGFDAEFRIIGFTATVADAGQSTLQFNLALPPTLSIGGPALP